MLAGIVFHENFMVLRAALIPHAVVLEHATYAAHVRAWRFLLRDSVWSLKGVRDLTAELRAVDA